MARWFIARGTKQHGPVDDQKLRQLAASGKLKPDDIVRREDEPAGRPAKDIEGLLPLSIDDLQSESEATQAKPHPTPPTQAPSHVSGPAAPRPPKNLTDAEQATLTALLGMVLGLIWSVWFGNYLWHGLIGAILGVILDRVERQSSNGGRFGTAPAPLAAKLGFILFLTCIFEGGCTTNSEYRDGYAAGKEYGTDIRQYNRMMGWPKDLQLTPSDLDNHLDQMRASGVDLPRSSSGWKKYTQGFKNGVAAGRR
jgi:hypothetical protein